MGNFLMKGLAEGRGPETAVFDPENVYLVGIDGDDPEHHPLYDAGAVAYLRPLRVDPGLLFTPAYELMLGRIVTLARYGFEAPAVVRRAPHTETVGVDVVAGRHRTMAGRLLNGILGGTIKAPSGVKTEIAQAMAEARLPPSHRVLLPCYQSKADDLEARAAVHRENLMRRVLSPTERFSAIAAEVRSGDANGSANLAKIARSLGVSQSEVAQVAQVVRRGEDAVVAATERGEIRPSVAAALVALPHSQAAALEAVKAAGDGTAAAVTRVVDRVSRGEDVGAAAAAVSAERRAEKTARRVGLSVGECRDLLEAAKASGATTFATALRLVLEGPDALSPQEARSFGLHVAIDAIRSKRNG